ncbi:hypothetical protein [Aquiflexum sp.]|uniref:hypothetical protein n=1 Tax=Aquiflexum sp. TaxID=1872584 RepID=UPI003594265B
MKQVLYWVLTLSFLISSCKTAPVRREINSTDQIQYLNPENKFIKAHMKDGSVFILNFWFTDDVHNNLSGYGELLNIQRRVVERRVRTSNRDELVEPFTFPFDEVALVETNDQGNSLGGGLVFTSGLIGGVALLCLFSPKTCFGSCPTFYAETNDTLRILAEGFSTSILPSLEINDIDMLYEAKYKKDFQLTLTNEALETHSIRYANILCFEKEEHQKVFATSEGDFYVTENSRLPNNCKSLEGDCLEEVKFLDHKEYFSESDSDNLHSKEDLILDFDIEKAGNFGLVLGKRQTMMTTFILYQGLAYMGKSVSYFLAQYELGNLEKKSGILELLGGVEIYFQNRNLEWIYAGEVNEPGPIATDFNMVKIDNVPQGNLKIKLVMNKGLWRIDYLTLVDIEKQVNPTVVGPYSAENIFGKEKEPLAKLLDPEDFLVTYPGEKFLINYQLPFEHAELFLDSKGFYLEWIREDWIKEQNFRKLNQMVKNPTTYLKKIAKEYKKVEPVMEEAFWNSRYVY